MNAAKTDQNKVKLRVKQGCSSNQSSKFIEKECLNGLSLSFSNASTSLCDFIPKETESLSHEMDFEISKNLRKLEKKDPITKQKSLNELLEMFAFKDKLSVISTLKFWPKLYNRLSLDEDKKVRELTQQLMWKYSSISGKEISIIIKQLLPSWIISQSDLHLEAAAIAKKSFVETFPTKVKQEKAYLLCWRSIYEIVSGNLLKNPITIKEGSISYSTQEETYIQEIVVNMRTIITLIPYLKQNEEACNDLAVLLKSKQFWSHGKQKVNLIQSVYLQLGADLLDHLLDLVTNNSLISSQVCECIRMIDTVHAHLVSRTWMNIVKCCDMLGSDHVWRCVSFKSVFLPKFIKLLECGADGNISQLYGCMLPLLTHLPIDATSEEGAHLFVTVLQAMIKGSECTRVTSNETEANSAMQMIYECSVYVTITAGHKNNLSLVDIVLNRVLHATERYLTDPKFRKTTRAVVEFPRVVIRPLVSKGTVSPSRIVDTLVGWVDTHYGNETFCELFTSLLAEVAKCFTDDIVRFKTLLLERTQSSLKEKIAKDSELSSCLVPYLYVCLFSDKSTWHQAAIQLAQCAPLISIYSGPVTGIVSQAIGRILSSSSPDSIPSQFGLFLSSLSRQKAHVFFTQFYRSVLSHLDETNFERLVATCAVSFWTDTVHSLIDEQINHEDNHKTVTLTLSTIFELCRTIKCHEDDLTTIISCLDRHITVSMTKFMSSDAIDRLVDLMTLCISELDSLSRLSALPPSFIKNLLSLVLCNSSTDCSLQGIATYLHKASLAVSMDLLHETLSSLDCTDFKFLSNVLAMILNTAPNEDDRQSLVARINWALMQDLVAIDSALEEQLLYSPVLVHSRLDLVMAAIHKVNILLPLVGSPLMAGATINETCVVLAPIFNRAFHSCHNSNNVLNQCEAIHTYLQSMDHNSIIDQLLACTTRSSGVDSTQDITKSQSVYGRCTSLVLCSLQHLIPTNYSHWTQATRLAVDHAIDCWCDDQLTRQQFHLMTRVLLPCAAKARYIVQEVVLATIMSYLSEDARPTLANVNRAVSIMTVLSTVDHSYFPLCYPILMSVRPQFDQFIGQLHPAQLDPFTDSSFNLTGLLEFLTVGVDSCVLNEHQWEFVLCLVDTLIRSEPFSTGASNYRTGPVTAIDRLDHVVNVCWLLRLVAAAAVTVASVKMDSVIDEWDNLFSEPIFTAVLDQFSLVSGDHAGGKLVHGHLFTFYLEAVSDAVSLCPVHVLLAHNFQSRVSINDPVDLPADFLVVFNSLLESMSSYCLSVQLAAYNCLVNLTDTLSHLLLDRVTASEKDESQLDQFCVNLPHKLLDYMDIGTLDQLPIDSVDNQIVLIRCFLAWSIVLQLFSASQPKVRAVIGTFLTHNDRCFDKFLNFCFAFMPKNPIVNKKHLSFLHVATGTGSAAVTGTAGDNNHSCNLIADEPHIFSQCVEKRTKFIIYHLSAHMFRRSMQVLPNLCRQWWKSLDSTSQQLVDTYVRQFLTRELFKIEFKQLKHIVDKEFDDKLDIKALPSIGEVTVQYNVSADQSLEQVIKLPTNYPIGSIRAEFKKELTVKIPHWKSWVGQMTMTLENQNGSIFDGIKLWKRNLDNYFSGVDDCMICYSIVHASNFTLPSMPCYQCKKKFHKECMYKWFQSSTNPTCPNCRNVFYDGSQKYNK